MVPKKRIINALMEIYNPAEIRRALNIGPDTDLKKRLDGFTKPKLEEYLQRDQKGKTLYDNLMLEYPITAPATLYLLLNPGQFDHSEIIAKSSNIAALGRAGGMDFATYRAVRIVYLAAKANVLQVLPDVLEIPIYYERNLTYTTGDHRLPEYGEETNTYELKRAYFWVVKDKEHSLLYCRDFQALMPIMSFLNLKFSFKCYLPNISEEMLTNLAADSSPRSMTFTLDYSSAQSDEAQTVTLHDRDLANKQTFISLQADETHHKTAGYFSKHPDIHAAGIGISRRYGRIWTPAVLNKRDLLHLAIGLISKTEIELDNSLKSDRSDYLQYYNNYKITLNNKSVIDQTRCAFNDLLRHIIRLASSEGRETNISKDLLDTLIKHQNDLDIITAVSIDCSDCGVQIATCDQCGLSYNVKMNESKVEIFCSNCESSVDESSVHCDCGQPIEILDVRNHVKIYPMQALIRALHDFIKNNIERCRWDGTFYIDGYNFRLIEFRTTSIGIGRVYLNNLLKWNNTARISVRKPSETNLIMAKKIIRVAREKCPIKKYHPTREDCELCRNNSFSCDQFLEGSVCLPRMFGLPIATYFDGIHHGRELADIKYSDEISGSDGRKKVNIGIHLKSYYGRKKAKGLGRSVDKIKSLYTQVCHSAYESYKANDKFDIIGISIPNVVNYNVINELHSILNNLGFSFILVDEESWLCVITACIEDLEFNHNSNSPATS